MLRSPPIAHVQLTPNDNAFRTLQSIQGRQVEPTQATRVTNYINLGNLVALNDKAHDCKYLSARKPRHDSSGAVDEHRLNPRCKVREHQRAFRRNPRPADLP